MAESTILIVDDNPENLTVLGELLAPNYRVKIANTGRRALEIAGTTPQPDLVLLDIMMPGMDGYEVLEHLRMDPRTRDIPVVFVTAMDSARDEQWGLGLGAADYIPKPLKPAVVMARVRTQLELKRARLAQGPEYVPGKGNRPPQQRLCAGARRKHPRARPPGGSTRPRNRQSSDAHARIRALPRRTSA